MNPYKVLGLVDDAPFDAVRDKFKKLALMHHPDKGGNPEYFRVLQDAYKCIFKDYQKKQQFQKKVDVPVKPQKYKTVLEEDEIDGLESIHVDPKKFDVNKFNQVFDKYRITDTHVQKGYSDKDFEEEKIDEISGKVGGDEFNRRFESQKKKYSKDVVVFKEPEPLTFLTQNKSLDFYELGIDDVEDFTSQNYVDYKKAYSPNNKFISPDLVDIKKKTINQVKSERENVKFDMTEEDRQYIEMKKREEEMVEERRLNKLREKDEYSENVYKKINKKLLK